jgi:prophage regulatory protein
MSENLASTTSQPPTPSGEHRNATAMAGDLHSIPKIDPLLKIRAVLALFPVSRSHFYAGVAAGKFPAPVRLSTRCVAWRTSDIAKLIKSL